MTVVACPSEDDTEDTESIIVERQWDTQMQYLIAISGRSFPIGGVIPFSITFVPWTKMKVFRLSLVIEGMHSVTDVARHSLMLFQSALSIIRTSRSWFGRIR